MVSKYSYLLLKPDVSRDILYPLIVKDVEVAGFDVIKHQSCQLNEKQIEAIYKKHKEKEWFPKLVDFLMKDSCLLLIVKQKDIKDKQPAGKILDAVESINQFKGKVFQGGLREKYRLAKNQDKFFENRVHTPDSYQEFLENLSLLLDNEALNDLRLREPELYDSLLRYQREGKELKIYKR
ncbi:MAG: nucleoside-diphosphate kinase [Patescibacteria group bacterium]